MLQEQVDAVIINRKLEPLKKPQAKINWLVMLLFVIVVAVEGILYLNMRQRSAESEELNLALEAELARVIK